MQFVASHIQIDQLVYGTIIGLKNVKKRLNKISLDFLYGSEKYKETLRKRADAKNKIDYFYLISK